MISISNSIIYIGVLILKINMGKNKCIHCSYEWEKRVDNPKACPNCKRRLSSPYNIRKPLNQVSKHNSLNQDNYM